ncbi:MAG TPA: hypothetical protein VE870_04255 [Bacteroidales bacterium]|nr:hypothetical protein [Bacteroidales bacterium]
MIIASEYYHERKDRFGKQVKLLRKKTGYVALFRLFTMVLSIYFLIKGINTSHIYWYVLSVSFLVAFVWLVNFHRNLKLKKDKAQALIDININELKAMGGDYSVFENGSEFLNSHHEFTYDLDIFGERSLFQFLNRTCSFEGKSRLARDLLNSPFQRDQISVRQDMYRELAEKPDLMQSFRSAGLLSEDNPGEKEEIMNWLTGSNFNFSSWRKIMMYVIPLAFILIILFGVFFNSLFDYLLPLVLISFVVNGAGMTSVNHYHQKISKKHEILGKYLELNRIIARAKFSHPVLSDYAKSSNSSLEKFRKLNSLMNYLDSRLNIIVGLTLNIIFMFDLHIIRLLESWRMANKDTLDSFFTIPAFVDSAISFSTFHFNNPGFCWPSIKEEGLEARKLGHPLIPADKRVVNDFVTGPKERIFIVTGANMAGKSTFLRTLGVNMILAGTGAPVCSSAFNFEPLSVITGMRTTDSLADSESYFYAELKRLKRIVDMLTRGDKILVLLDEILKGTNSTDKHNGSVALVKKFTGNNCLALIATHDLALGNLADELPSSVVNLHFESYIRGDDLRFDYLLKKGIAKNMNASFLMQKMGIIE